VIRVEVQDEGLLRVTHLDESAKKESFTMTKDEVPIWMSESVALLAITDCGVNVDGIGVKVGTGLFYLIDRTGVDDA
jgi:hypothetical protein